MYDGYCRRFNGCLIMEWFKKNPVDYRRDTWHLSLAGHGAYNLLIDYYYLHESPLPADDLALSSIIGKPLEDWLSVKDEVLQLFKKKGSRLHHKRCNRELNSSYEKRRDGAQRQKTYRKLLKDKDPVTRQSHVSNATRGEEMRGEENEDTNVSSSSKSDVKIAFELFQIMAKEHGTPVPQDLTDDRKTKLTATLKKCDGIEGWKSALEKVSKSDHCTGINDRGWKANLDFLLSPASFTKLMEGNYDNRAPGNSKSGTNTPGNGRSSPSITEAVARAVARSELRQGQQPIVDDGYSAHAERFKGISDPDLGEIIDHDEFT